MKRSTGESGLSGIGPGKSNATPPEELLVGWAEADISPPKTVRLHGQAHERICTPDMHHDPITATVLALESKSGREQAVFVSVDLCEDFVTRRLRTTLAARLPGLDTSKVFVNATHTHTAPLAVRTDWEKKKLDAGMTGEEYAAFLTDRLAAAVIHAWKNKGVGKIARAKGSAAVGFCRNAVYEDGSAVMYGDTSLANFKEMQSDPDHDVNILYFGNTQGDLTGVVINLACPSQAVEGKCELSADFWHEVRTQLRARFSGALNVMAQCSAAGDMSPRNLQDRNLSDACKFDWPGMVYNGTMIARAVIQEYGPARERMTGNIEFMHRVRNVGLTRKESGHGPFPVELHAVRLGDTVLVTNPFELYVDYGRRIKAGSPAAQTFVVQLTGYDKESDIWRGPCYLPTAKAAMGGAYGSQKEHGPVGPDGGRELVDHTLALIDAMWGR